MLLMTGEFWEWRGKIQKNLNLIISKKTFQHRLNENKLKPVYQKKKNLLLVKLINEKASFFFFNINMPISFWKKVIWSVESKFELFGLKQEKV